MHAAMWPNVDTLISIIAGLDGRAIQIPLKWIKSQWQLPSLWLHFSWRSPLWSWLTVLLAMALHGAFFISFERNPLGHEILGVGCLSMIDSVSSVHFVFWLNLTRPPPHFDNMSIHRDWRSSCTCHIFKLPMSQPHCGKKEKKGLSSSRGFTQTIYN